MINSINPKTGRRVYEEFVKEYIKDELIRQKFCEVLKNNIKYFLKVSKTLEKHGVEYEMI